jgi:Spy/CpxP family protein refolding chaperone
MNMKLRLLAAALIAAALFLPAAAPAQTFSTDQHGEPGSAPFSHWREWHY